eukprot:3847113-Pyramimonas_sp.AAC.1
MSFCRDRAPNLLRGCWWAMWPPSMSITIEERGGERRVQINMGSLTWLRHVDPRRGGGMAGPGN